MGADIGSILNVVFMVSPNKTVESVDPGHCVADFIVGFFQALGQDFKVDDILGCVGNAEAIYDLILKTINDFENLDLKNVLNVIKAIEDILDCIKQVMESVKGCAIIAPEMLEIIKKIEAFDIKRRMTYIITHITKIVSDI